MQCPDGIIAHLAGPYEGRRNDTGILTDSAFTMFMASKLQLWGMNLVMYADAGYLGNSVTFIAPHTQRHGVSLTPDQVTENLRMSNMRVCVEHAFGKICNLWPYVMHYRQLKTMLQPVGLYYRLAVLLTNCHTCLYGCQTSDAFSFRPPTLHHYLGIPNTD